MRGTFSTCRLAIRGAGVLGCGAALVMALHAWQTAAAAEPAAQSARQQASDARKKPSPPGLDDTLLKDLDNELLEGAGELKNRPASKSEKAGPQGEKRPAQPTAGEDVGLSQQDDDPLFFISQEMRSAGSLIPEHAKRLDAEQLQRQVIEDLSKLIEQAEQQSAQQQSSSSQEKKSQQTQKRQSVQQPKSARAGGSKNSNQPANDSSERLSKSEPAHPDPAMIKGLLKDSWGNLPPKDREQMLQKSPERFLPQYELMIERYYRRLAEEQNSK